MSTGYEAALRAVGYPTASFEEIFGDVPPRGDFETDVEVAIEQFREAVPEWDGDDCAELRALDAELREIAARYAAWRRAVGGIEESVLDALESASSEDMSSDAFVRQVQAWRGIPEETALQAIERGHLSPGEMCECHRVLGLARRCGHGPSERLVEVRWIDPADRGTARALGGPGMATVWTRPKTALVVPAALDDLREEVEGAGESEWYDIPEDDEAL